MNLAAYMSRPVQSLADRVPPCKNLQKEKQKMPQGFAHGNCVAANVAKREQAIARYKVAMAGEWCSTRTIENRLGMSRSSCTPNLNKWLGLELLEKREVGGDTNWNRMKGFEWRFAK